MSGHSKWAKIKRQKGVADASRGQLFTKLAREIGVAVREGGPDPQSNFKLRLVVQKAKDSNLPLENIERAIRRASGGTDGVALAEVNYEGYGPGGSAILIHALTDNKNRIISEIRNILSRGGGNLGESGCVTWLFDARGVIVIDATNVNDEEVALFAIDAGADDVKVEGNTLEVYTQPQDLEAVRRALELKKVAITSSELSMVPKTLVKLDEKSALQALKLMDKLEELDEVQHVYTNADFPDEVLAKYQG
ncbi:MAG TPA: YebC/PmpR family DNA-binding transcriptional regulator [Dehalococcoidia bacterium]|nr:YebC/PmpR family DNA-binding transcriptional regulator [Dehalococcoidia bacterium]